MGVYKHELEHNPGRFQHQINLWRDLSNRATGHVDSAIGDVVYISRERLSVGRREDLLTQIHEAIKTIPLDSLNSVDASVPFKGYKFSLVSPDKKTRMDVFLTPGENESWHLILMSRPKMKTMFDFARPPSDLDHINLSFPGSRNLLRVEIDGLWWHFETEKEALLAFVKMQDHDKVLLILGRSLLDPLSLSQKANDSFSLTLATKEIFANPAAFEDFTRQVEAHVSLLPESLLRSQIGFRPGLLLSTLPDAYSAPTLVRRQISDQALALAEGESIPSQRDYREGLTNSLKNPVRAQFDLNTVENFKKKPFDEQFERYEIAQGRLEGRRISSEPGCWLTTDMTNPTMRRSEAIRYPKDLEKQRLLRLEKEDEDIIAHVTNQLAP